MTQPSGRAPVCANCGCTHPARQRGRTHAGICKEHGCEQYVPTASAPPRTEAPKTTAAQRLASGVNAALVDNAIGGPHRLTLTALLSDYDEGPSSADTGGAAETADESETGVICRKCGTLISGVEAGSKVRWVECRECQDVASLRARLAETEGLLRRVVAWDDDHSEELFDTIAADIRATLTGGGQ